MCKKSNEAGEKIRKQELWGEVEENGVVKSREERAEGGPHHFIQLPERRLQ